jgi:hypothetical protein
MSTLKGRGPPMTFTFCPSVAFEVFATGKSYFSNREKETDLVQNQTRARKPWSLQSPEQGQRL